MEKIWSIYVHINKINGKKYVGMTTNIKLRWASKGKRYIRHPKFFKDIEKYGWDNFEHKVLAITFNKENAIALEKFYIKFYDSKENGYNDTEGGPGSWGFHQSEEMKKDASERRKGIKLSEETKKKLSSIRKGRKIHRRKNDWTKEQREKVSERVNRQFQDKEFCLRHKKSIPNRIEVSCEGKDFLSITECAEFYNVPPTAMLNWLNGKIAIPQEFVEKELFFRGVNPSYLIEFNASKRMVCEGKIFSNISECSKFYGINTDTMRSWFNGKCKSGVPDYFKNKGLRFIETFKFRIDPKFYNKISKGEINYA